MKKILLAAIVVLAFFVRLYKIDNPVADWHSFRQADTASVTQNFVTKGLDLLHPTYQDLSNIQSGKDNPNGYRMVEFPLYNLIHYSVYNLNPEWGIDKSGRLTSVFISLISLIFVYLISSRLSGEKTGLLAALIFAVLPFNIYYSRVILPEPLMIMATLGSFYFLQISLTKTKTQSLLFLTLSCLFFAMALLVKPYAVFFSLPFIYLIAINLGALPYHLYILPIFAAISIAPLLLWRQWILQYPAGIPASDWLYNTNGIRFRPAWFRWLFAERLSKLILGYWGTAPFIFGLISKYKNKAENSYILWFVGIILYFSIFAGGNVTHDYYQSITMPFIAMILAKGFSLFSGIKSRIALLVCFAFMIGFSWYEIKGYYQINNGNIIKAGMAADKLLPKDAKVIAPYNGDTAFLYQTRRSGWPEITYDIRKIIENGADYYVSVNYDDKTNYVLKSYTKEIIEKNSDYVIVKLK